MLALLLATAPALAGAAAEESEALAIFHRLAPRGQVHFSRCWHLEHDYYELRQRIAETGVVWRRQQLERQWEEVRDRRRETCLMGW